MLISGARKDNDPLRAAQPPSDPTAGTAGRPKRAKSKRGKRMLGKDPSLAVKSPNKSNSEGLLPGPAIDDSSHEPVDGQAGAVILRASS